MPLSSIDDAVEWHAQYLKRRASNVDVLYSVLNEIGASEYLQVFIDDGVDDCRVLFGGGPATQFASTTHTVDAAATHEGKGSAVGVQQISSRLQQLLRDAITRNCIFL